MNTRDPTVAEAIDWMVQMRSGQATAEDVMAFAAWRASDTRHEAAAQHVESVLLPFEQLRERGVPPHLARRTMLRARRRATRRAALSLGVMGLGVAGIFSVTVPCADCVFADGSTGFAQRSEQRLPDGSLLWLDAHTAVDFDFGLDRSVVQLRRGRVLAQAALKAASPLELRTPHVQVRCQHARIVAHAKRAATELTVLDGNVVCESMAGDAITVEAGRRMVWQATGPAQSTTASGGEDLWTRGYMALNDQALGDLIEAMQGYRRGVLQIDDAAARLRVSGLFSLDDPDATLRALAATQPVRIREITRYWVVISLAQG